MAAQGIVFRKSGSGGSASYEAVVKFSILGASIFLQNFTNTF